MWGRIFNPDNDFFRLTGKLVDLVILSVFWLVCSLPLFTLGPATAALYQSVVQGIRGNARNSWLLFFRTFRDNFKVGALASLPTLAAGALLVLLHELIYQTTAVGRPGYILYFAYCVFLLLPMGTACYLFPVLSRFTFGVGGLLSNCAKLAIAHLPSTVALALIDFLSLWVFLNFPLAAAVLPALAALLHSLLLERIFRPYVDAQLGPRPGEGPPEAEAQDRS